jgi:hypothetical protein
MKEMINGDTETDTNFVGASAPASQSAAENPQNSPSFCNICWRACAVRPSPVGARDVFFCVTSLHPAKKQKTNHQNREWNPEMYVS